MNEYIAHSENSYGIKHGLKNHLQGVADLMNQFCIKPEYNEIFRTTALLHDIGKFQIGFQKYLIEGGPRGSVPHASIGAALCADLKDIEGAFVIDGHHKGLPDLGALKVSLAPFRKSEDLQKITSAWENELQLNVSNFQYRDIGLRLTEKEFFIRYLYSSLTDADWLDTEQHFDESITVKRGNLKFDCDKLIQDIEKELEWKSKEGYINELRNNVRTYAISKADMPSGFYSMTLPTGMGKTIASITWALHHAKKNNMQRIIIVLPFLSIIDQTAKELKRIFGTEIVLEHHSNIVDDDENIANENLQNEQYVKRLSMENWDYPIIVTTSVQFFESLFSNKPSKCRKIHNIAKSVVIFDEVQTLPKGLVEPTLEILQNMQKVIGTSFLFCTATQPAFIEREGFKGIKNIFPLVKAPELIFETCKRVIYSPIENYSSISTQDLAESILGENLSVLVICNTKKQTLLLFEALQESGIKVIHLSTSMYPAHRKRVIANVRKALENKEPIIVCSTQLIEAGVDFDFPCVYRELAPMESIIQSAGRCNREGKMANLGDVKIFRLSNSGSPDKQYKALAEYALSCYQKKESELHNYSIFTEYYGHSMDLFIDGDKKKINELRNVFNYKTVAGAYKLIESKTTPIFIHCDESDELYERIKYKEFLSKKDFRGIQQYSTMVYDNFLRENHSYIQEEKQGYLRWLGIYDEDYGLSQNPEKQDDYII
ncbi:MAG: hypothetical protein B6241_10605 [Spirochaetaceae bacterium 4572_59]|nr:MAG: hypothetical protein B6241_10605 [Spirochaetaceae bacterium 4572_59]